MNATVTTLDFASTYLVPLKPCIELKGVLVMPCLQYVCCLTHCVPCPLLCAVCSLLCPLLCAVCPLLCSTGGAWYTHTQLGVGMLTGLCYVVGVPLVLCEVPGRWRSALVLCAGAMSVLRGEARSECYGL